MLLMLGRPAKASAIGLADLGSLRWKIQNCFSCKIVTTPQEPTILWIGCLQLMTYDPNIPIKSLVYIIINIIIIIFIIIMIYVYIYIYLLYGSIFIYHICLMSLLIVFKEYP